MGPTAFRLKEQIAPEMSRLGNFYFRSNMTIKFVLATESYRTTFVFTVKLWDQNSSWAGIEKSYSVFIITSMEWSRKPLTVLELDAYY